MIKSYIHTWFRPIFDPDLDQYISLIWIHSIVCIPDLYPEFAFDFLDLNYLASMLMIYQNWNRVANLQVDNLVKLELHRWKNAQLSEVRTCT